MPCCLPCCLPACLPACKPAQLFTLLAQHQQHSIVSVVTDCLTLQAGGWSIDCHFCFPPAFRAAARELLLISHKHGGARRRDGQLRWPFRKDELIGLLLPAMGRSSSMRPWVTQ